MATAFTREHLVDNSVLEHYKWKTQPMISVCEKGSDNWQLDYPHGLAIDHNTGNIYIADNRNHCVKVFNRTCKYLFKFGDRGEGKINYPKCLVITRKKVLVSTHCITAYKLDGRFISRIGTYGSGALRFLNPIGLCSDKTNGDIYVCDRDNNYIQIITDGFKFKSQFGKDILKQPLDIKLYKGEIFVLDESNPCLHIFNKDLVLRKSVISRGIEAGRQVVFPTYFCIDKFGNILVSDTSGNSILIFNSKNESVHKLYPFFPPMGIVVDEKYRIIVTTHSEEECLHIF